MIERISTMLTLELIKQHCRIDVDVDDELLQAYHRAARTYIQSLLNRKLYNEAESENDRDGIVINPAIEQAILMTIAHWYEHRESVVVGTISSKEVEEGVWRLIQPYRKMGV